MIETVAYVLVSAAAIVFLIKEAIRLRMWRLHRLWKKEYAALLHRKTTEYEDALVCASLAWESDGREVAKNYVTDYVAQQGITMVDEDIDENLQMIRSDYVHFVSDCVLMKLHRAIDKHNLKVARITGDLERATNARKDHEQHMDSHRVALKSVGYNVAALEKQYAT